MNTSPIRVLVTGASGYIGSRLTPLLRARGCSVIAFGRSRPGDADIVRAGSFTSPADLARLDDLGIDVVVHLAGVTGAAAEADAIQVNVEGTRLLMRTMIDRGVRRFVVASSIAAAGCLTEEFLPQVLPIPASHPCLSANAYGLSKYIVEELARYFARTDSSLELDLYRIGLVVSDPDYRADVSSVRLPFCELGTVPIGTVVDRITSTIVAPRGPGVRVENLVAPEIPSPLPTIDTLAAVLGPRASRLDLSAYRRAGNERAGLWAVTKGT
jgi:nucleoside-diphosphate-sugar epimerase